MYPLGVFDWALVAIGAIGFFVILWWWTGKAD